MVSSPSRDWSVWIDTIETSALSQSVVKKLMQSGLICLDWYDWNLIFKIGLQWLQNMSGLICLDWYDWNFMIVSSNIVNEYGRDWSVWIDTIETSGHNTHHN